MKNLSAVQKIWVQSLSWKDPQEKGMATHSSILAYRISGTKEPGGEPKGHSPWGHKKSDRVEKLTLFFFFLVNQ